MSDNRKFGYTLGTTFRRANRLGTRYGADVFCVVRRRGPRPRLDLYRNTGINWARTMDLNNLEQLMMDDTRFDFRLVRPSNFITASNLDLSNTPIEDTGPVAAPSAAPANPLTLEDWANRMQENQTDRSTSGENTHVPETRSTLEDWASLVQDMQADHGNGARVGSVHNTDITLEDWIQQVAPSADELSVSWVDLNSGDATMASLPVTQTFPGLTVNTSHAEQMPPVVENAEVISAGLAGMDLNMTFPDIDFGTSDVHQPSPSAEGIFDFEAFGDCEDEDGSSIAR